MYTHVCAHAHRHKYTLHMRTAENKRWRLVLSSQGTETVSE